MADGRTERGEEMRQVDAMAHLVDCGVVEPRVDWNPAARQWCIFEGERILAKDAVLRIALDRAGYPKLTPKIFAARGSRIFLDADSVAVARSGTMAQRIAKALNTYRPGPKGY